MKKLVERDSQSGVELVSEVRIDPAGDAMTIYSVWQVAPNGSRLGISGFDPSDLSQAKGVFSQHVQSLKASDL